MATVSIQGISKSYGQNTVVRDLSLDVAAGEFVTLLGPSGCGKTTTLRCVAGLERPDSGSVHIGGRVVATGGRHAVPPERRNLGMVFQSYSLWPHMTVFGNVAYPLRARRAPRHDVPGRVHEALRLVGLEHLANRSVGMLSGGQQQRVALARALVSEPQLLLFDEPLSNLDAQLRASMRNELRELHARLNTTSIYVTHDQLEALTLSDRVVVMNDGSIQQIGTPAEIYAAPANTFVARFVGFDNFLPGRVTARRGDMSTVKFEGFDELVDIACPESSVHTGQLVWAAMRSSALTVGVDGDSAARARVLDATFLGDAVEYRLAVGPHTLTARAAGQRPQDMVAVGSVVPLRLPVYGPVLLDGEDSTGFSPIDRIQEVA